MSNLEIFKTNLDIFWRNRTSTESADEDRQKHVRAGGQGTVVTLTEPDTEIHCFTCWIQLLNNLLTTKPIPHQPCARTVLLVPTGLEKERNSAMCCVYCDRVLHFTPECSGFPEQSIQVLIELKHNLLHVCNDCTQKKSNREPLDEKQKQQMQLNFNEINKKISDCSENVLKSFKIMEELQKEINSLKTKPAYSAVVGNATAGKLVDVPVLETKKLEIRVKGIPEAQNENADKRLATDRTEINSLLHYLGVETKITKLSRVGQYDKNKGPRTILFDLETQVDKD